MEGTQGSHLCINGHAAGSLLLVISSKCVRLGTLKRCLIRQCAPDELGSNCTFWLLEIPSFPLIARLFLQQRKSASSIESSRALHKYDRTDVVAQPIDKSSNKVELIGVGIICFELVDQLGELIHILNDSGGLADVTELPENKFMLVTAETFMDQGTEAGPVEILEKMFDGLEPTAHSPLELHSGTANPHARINEIHFKVSLGLRNPKLGIITIEGWEVKFRKLASGDMMR